MRRSAVDSTAQVLLCLTVAWGVFAFGAPYPWAYWPLAAAAGLTGALGLAAGWRSSGIERLLVGALLAVGAAIAVQLIPLAPETLERLTPGTVPVLRRLDPAFFVLGGRHAISIWPARTQVALGLYAALATLMLGTASLLSRRGAAPTLASLTVLGAVVAVVGITIRPGPTGEIYGFWTPQHKGSPYGPFVNHNHFAGWMLMACPLALGLLCARATTALPGVKSGWRTRLVWASSIEANKAILLIMAVLVMALAVVLSTSRSGVSAFLMAILLFAWFLNSGASRKSSGATAAICVVALAFIAIWWAGVDPVVQRFTQLDWPGLNYRRGAWSDAERVAGAFPLTGTGLNTYGAAMLLFQQYDLMQYYSEAHNDYLQLAAEGGALLSIPAACLIAAFVWSVRRRLAEDKGTPRYWVRAGAVTGIAAIGIQEAVEFSLQMPGNAALFAVVCGIALHKSPEEFVMRSCPKCTSPEIHRSRSKSRWETWRREITGKRQFRCHECGWRGWGVDTGRKSAEDVGTALNAIAPVVPDPKRIAPSDDDGRAEDDDLTALDRYDSVARKKRPI